jgi:peptidyl-prolyl cis-trans isomerase B (cyclophilin B)
MSPAAAVVFFSILFPAKGWVASDQPINIDVKTEVPITLVLTDFTGKPLDADANPDVGSAMTVDVRRVFKELAQPGTYILYATPRGTDVAKTNEVLRFVGTPLVLDVREDPRREAQPGPMVTRVEPLKYAVIHTDKGDMTCIFYYDVAPTTTENFLTLASDGFYNGLSFFRVVPGMLIQTGDPRGDGTGGPGYHIEAEFNNRQHSEGVMSMARQIDPIEKQGAAPRTEAANSAGSQFFMCLSYDTCKQLDRRYTAFGRITAGLDVLHAIGEAPNTGTGSDTPKNPVIVKGIEVLPVTMKQNPYAELLSFAKPVALPTTVPSSRN